MIDERRKAQIEASPPARPGLIGWARHTLGASPPGLSWALAAGFGLLCVVLIYVGNSLRQQVALLRQQLDQSAERENEARTQQENLQAQARQEASNYSQRLTNFQTQLAGKANDFSRRKEAMEKRLAQKTDEVQRQTNALQRQLEKQVTENKLLMDALTVTVTQTNRNPLARMKMILLSAAPETAANAVAASVWDAREQKGLLRVENLPPLPPEKDYQLWLFDPKILSPISAGVFRTDEQGKAVYRYQSSALLESVEKLVVSIERSGGVPLPLGKVVLASR